MKKWIQPLLLFALLSGSVGMTVLGGCTSAPKTPESTQAAPMLTFNPEMVNRPELQDRPYVVLVSIDGYRYDYNKLFGPPHLNEIAKEGVAADSLSPIYPSKTFPNHYSIVTGLYSDRHGIVSNEFYDPARGAVYSLPDRKAVEDGTWYSGEPLWIAAEKQGMVTASFFWVGSESDIQGMHPNYYYKFDGSVSNEKRVDQVLEWLKLPAAKRPHLITLYFNDVDTAAHKFGVESQQTRDAVAGVDTAMGRLREGLKSLELPVNLIVVSDHGMENLDPKKVILLDQIAGAAPLLAKFRLLGRGPQMQLYLNKGENRKAIRDLERVLERGAKHFRVLNRRELARYHYDSMARVGDLVIEPDAPYSFGTTAEPPNTSGGNHGWDARKTKAMHGIFYATGPAFKTGVKLPTFENIHVYPLVLEVLGLKQTPGIDGKVSVTRAALAPRAVHGKKAAAAK